MRKSERDFSKEDLCDTHSIISSRRLGFSNSIFNIMKYLLRNLRKDDNTTILMSLTFLYGQHCIALILLDISPCCVILRKHSFKILRRKFPDDSQSASLMPLSCVWTLLSQSDALKR